MIVKWNLDGIKVIPKSDGIGSVILAPGYNQIESANWAYARPRVLDQIERGIIVEEWTKTTPEQAKDFALTIQDGKNILAPAELSDLTRARANEVIANTYHIPTLEFWLDREQRGDMRIILMRRLTEIDRSNSEVRKIELAKVLEKTR